MCFNPSLSQLVVTCKVFLTLQVLHAFRTCMPVGAERFCAFLSRLVSMHVTDTLSFYNVFVLFWLLCVVITEKEALIQNGLLKTKLQTTFI